MVASGLLPAAPIRALIFSGRNNHEWRVTTPFLKKILEDTGRFDVRVVEEPTPSLGGYDVLVLDYNGPRWGAATEKAVEAFVRSGKGLVAVHAASYAFCGLPVLGDRHVRTNIIEPPWPEYAEMIGGHFSDQEPRTGHGQRHTFRVKFVDREHPIARGLDETFLATDELYHHMRMRPVAKILATAHDDPKMGGTGKDEPMLWTVGYGKGRVFHTALGHDLAAMREAGFMTTLARGAEWAATGGIAVAAQKAAAPPTRVLVVTGGHDYDLSFYKIFDGHPDIRATARPHPGPFGRDIHKRYDVIVLYDMVQEEVIGEAGQKNLREYLENGKGLVVLHHALASFNSWPWWSQEVVGGKYLLKPESGQPASTYKHDVELLVEPAGKHPVLAGVGRLHIWDETYKGMWISPDSTILLKTDHPTADGPVAWVSPYPKARVVVIQLGHDHAAHEHPGYQQLVRNAILWVK